MATPYAEIYDFFLEKVEDFSFIDTDIYETEEELYEELRKYLRSAIVRFKQCQQDLSDRDEEGEMFNLTLTDEEKEILSFYMVLAYVTPKIVSVQNMEQRLTDSEYKSYSQGKHLQEMISLKKELTQEISHLVSGYTYGKGLGGLL